MKRNMIAFSMLALFLFLMNGCKDSNSPKDEPPSVPPSSASFEIDFSDFGQTASLAKVSSVLTRDHWTRAFSVVAPWKLIMDYTLLVPRLAFVYTLNQKPAQQDDGSWRWYREFGQMQKFSAELLGKIVDSKVQWDMYISLANAYSNYHWFSGESNLDGSAGKWTLNGSPQNDQPFLQIDWTLNAADSTGSIRYTAVGSGDGNGSYIEYRRTTDTPYDKYFTLLDAKTDYQIDIQWSSVTKAGQIRDSLYFGNNNWQCWVSNRDDADCAN